MLEYLFLFGIGMLAVFIHAKMKLGLRIPGNHGLIFMSLLMAGRMATKNKYASSMSTLGAGLLILTPILAFRDPIMSVVVLLPGIALDLILNSNSKLISKIWFAGLAGGFAYMLIPVARLIFSLSTGYIYGNMIYGPLMPILTHFAFGAAGAAAIAAGASLLRNKNNK
jgi:hypothetical protein